MSSIRLILLLPIFTAAFSCSQFTREEDNIQPGEFAKLAYEPGAQVLDVRTIGEFRSGHLKGAMQADWLNLPQFDERTSYLDKENPIYVYCMSGNRGVEAAAFLRAHGFADVRNLDGGLIAWKSSGKKLVECKPHGTETPMTSYEKIITAAPQVIVGFDAAWSPPCIKMKPILSDFVAKHSLGVKVVIMDGSTESKLMRQLQVNALPTYILYRNGQEYARKNGVLTTEELEAWTSVSAGEENPSVDRISRVARKQPSHR